MLPLTSCKTEKSRVSLAIAIFPKNRFQGVSEKIQYNFRSEPLEETEDFSIFPQISWNIVLYDWRVGRVRTLIGRTWRWVTFRTKIIHYKASIMWTYSESRPTSFFFNFLEIFLYFCSSSTQPNKRNAIREKVNYLSENSAKRNKMVQRLTYRRNLSYNTSSNGRKIVKTPGGKLVYQRVAKKVCNCIWLLEYIYSIIVTVLLVIT